MRCFAERSGAKYGSAKCNEWTAYAVLYVLSGALRSESATGSSDSEKFKKYFSINFIL